MNNRIETAKAALGDAWHALMFPREANTELARKHISDAYTALMAHTEPPKSQIGELEQLRLKLSEYRATRDADYAAGEANNGGNMAGDELADLLEELLRSGCLTYNQAGRGVWGCWGFDGVGE